MREYIEVTVLPKNTRRHEVKPLFACIVESDGSLDFPYSQIVKTFRVLYYGLDIDIHFINRLSR